MFRTKFSTDTEMSFSVKIESPGLFPAELPHDVPTARDSKLTVAADAGPAAQPMDRPITLNATKRCDMLSLL
jgi:hypothetical protein